MSYALSGRSLLDSFRLKTWPGFQALKLGKKYTEPCGLGRPLGVRVVLAGERLWRLLAEYMQGWGWEEGPFGVQQHSLDSSAH